MDTSPLDPCSPAALLAAFAAALDSVTVAGRVAPGAHLRVTVSPADGSPRFAVASATVGWGDTQFRTVLA